MYSREETETRESGRFSEEIFISKIINCRSTTLTVLCVHTRREPRSNNIIIRLIREDSVFAPYTSASCLGDVLVFTAIRVGNIMCTAREPNVMYLLGHRNVWDALEYDDEVRVSDSCAPEK